MGCGLGLGPAIGSAVYDYLDYRGTMYMFGLLNALSLAICWYMMPSALNLNVSEPNEQEEESAEEDDSETLTDVTWGTVLKNKHCIFAMGTVWFGMFLCVYFVGFIAEEMLREGFSDNAAGYILGTQCLVYFLFCIGYPYLFGQWPRKLQFVLAFCGFGLAHLMIGPSQFLNLQDSVALRVCGFAFLGFCEVFVFIPIIPEMLEHLQVDLKISEAKNEALYNKLNDKVNDLYGFIYALGDLSGPLIGAWLYGAAGMRHAFDATALFAFGWALVLFVYNCGPNFIEENQRFEEEL